MIPWRTFNMKNLYIPTSSLNFNNILSSESISPKSFYEKRDFGYSRWEIIPENPFKNVVLLYDRLSLFDRPKSDIEDHPMLIEVKIEENELKPFSDGIFYVDKTIYLSPDRTFFIFFSEEDKNITLSLSESSLETKLYPLYHQRIKIEKPNERYKIINTTQEPSTLNNEEINKDIRLNKLKGLLYGYYIGTTLSANIDDIKRLNTLKEIHNIFAAILSSINQRPTNIQKEALDTLFEKLNEDEPFTKELSKIVESPNKVFQILDLIRKFWGQNLRLDQHEFLNLLTTQSLDSDKDNDAIQWIKGEIKKCQFKIERQRQLLSPEGEGFIISSNKLTSLKSSLLKGESEKKLTQEWVNETLLNPNYSGKISVNKDSLAKDITIKAKEVIGDNWENSIYKRHLNKLRHFIANEPTELEWNNDLLSSISAVLIYGDSWDKLLSNMQSKEMTNYSLAFAFFGELNGFANLTRDFTDTLYKNPNKNALWNIYQKINGQLLANFSSGNTSKFVETQNYIEHNPTKKNVIFKEIEVNSQPESDHIKSFIPECLKNLFDSEPFQILKKEEQDYYKSESLKLWEGECSKTFVSKLKSIKYGKTKSRKWTNCIKVLEHLEKKETTPQPLFSKDVFPIGSYFYNDSNVFYHIEDLISTTEDKKEIRDQINWIQKVHKDGGYLARNKWTPLDDHSNQSVINHFYNNCKKNSKINSNLLEAITSKLKELYHVN